MDWLEFTSQEYNSLYGVLSRFIGPFHGESRHVKNQPDENQKGTILTTLDGPLTPERSGSHLYIPQKRSWGLTTLTAAKKGRPFLKKNIRVSPPMYPWTRTQKPTKKVGSAMLPNKICSNFHWGLRWWGKIMKRFPSSRSKDAFLGTPLTGYPTSSCFPKNNFPKHYPDVPLDPLSVEAGNHENSSLRPVLRRSSTAPANCSTCISAWNLRWSFQPFGVGFWTL